VPDYGRLLGLVRAYTEFGKYRKKCYKRHRKTELAELLDSEDAGRIKGKKKDRIFTAIWPAIIINELPAILRRPVSVID